MVVDFGLEGEAYMDYFGGNFDIEVVFVDSYKYLNVVYSVNSSEEVGNNLDFEKDFRAFVEHMYLSYENHCYYVYQIVDNSYLGYKDKKVEILHYYSSFLNLFLFL
jgi:hypothetical protein